MESNHMLMELWKVKDDLAAQAGFDVERFLENLRQWERDHPHPGRVVHSAEELRQLVDEEERSHAQDHGMLLHDEPSHPEPEARRTGRPGGLPHRGD